MAVVARGPLVYCFEQADNNCEPELLYLSPDFQAVLRRADFANGAVVMDIRVGKTTMTAVPYYTWNNRGKGWMRTWLPLKTDPSLLYAGHTRK